MYHFEAFNIFSAPITGIFRPVEAEIRGDVPIFFDLFILCTLYTHRWANFVTDDGALLFEEKIRQNVVKAVFQIRHQTALQA